MSVRADYCARRYGVPVRTTRVYVGTPWYDGYVPAYSLELGRSRSYSRPTYSVNATRELIGEPAPRFGYGAETSRTEHTRHEPSEPEKSTPRIVTDESGTLMEEVSPANRPESVRLEKPAPEKKASVKADEKKTADQAGKKVAKKTVEDKSFPLARPSDRAGYVYSPHAPHNLIDATGFKPGDKAIDPTTGKPFMVP